MSRPKRSHGNRERLLERGLASLCETGYHGTGLQNMLTAEAVPKGSFYHYSPSKDAFAAESIGHYAEGVFADWDAYFARAGDDALAALRGYFRARVLAM